MDLVSRARELGGQTPEVKGDNESEWDARLRSMKIPADAIVAAEKLTHYLLLPRPWDDKAKFLAQAGFERRNPDALLDALRELASEVQATRDGENEYGEFLRTDGDLVGPNGRRLTVTAIWFRQHLDNKVRFVTLKPRRENPR